MSWQFRGDAPIYSQLVDRIRQKIAAGEYAPGQRLPAVREFAVAAGVNPNTMQRALAELERLGLVYSNRTAGRYVTEDPERILRERRSYASALAKDFCQTMGYLGFTKAEIIRIVSEEEEGAS